MRVHKATESATPNYPDRQEFQRCQVLIGSAVLGAAMVLGGCQTQHTGKTQNQTQTIGKHPIQQGPVFMPNGFGGPTGPGPTPITPPPPALGGVPIAP
jgi:hypothetical protein